MAYYPFDNAQRAGKVEKVTRTFDGTELIFDYQGALLKDVELGGAGPVAGTLEWGYQTGFLVASETVHTAGPSSDVVSYQYDDDRLLVQAGALTIDRDPDDALNGLIWDTTLGLSTDAYGYNTFGEIEEYSAFHDGTPKYEVFYLRDNLGRVTRRAERLGGGPSIEVREYAYHARGWLESVQMGTSSSCALSACACGAPVVCATAEAYTYDANGNRESASGSLVTSVPSNLTEYDAQDRQEEYGAASFVPDGEGRRATRTVGTDETLYVYAAHGELAQVTLPNADEVSYVLDPLGRRVGKKLNGVLERGWLWGSQHGPVAELADDGALAARFVYGTRSWVPVPRCGSARGSTAVPRCGSESRVGAGPDSH